MKHEKIDSSGKALVDFWEKVTDKGLVSQETGRAYRGACQKVLSIDEEWEQIDISQLDIEQAFRRFQNKNHKDYTPSSLKAYQERFKSAVRHFVSYTENPVSWKGPQIRSANTIQANTPKQTTSLPTNPSNAVAAYVDVEKPASLEMNSSPSILVEYPFPIRPGIMAVLKLPADLKMSEATRLAKHIPSLSMDVE